MRSLSRKQIQQRRLFLEQLEDRRLMTAIVQIAQEPGSVNEGETAATWVLTRDDTTGPLTVTYQLGGTAYPSIPDEPGIPGVVRDYIAPQALP